MSILSEVRAPDSVTLPVESEFDLDVTLLEVHDTGHLLNMTDDNCGNTCEGSTCISAA